jgi:hypothetical protein
MPFESADIRVDLVCGKRDDGHGYCSSALRVRADALRRLGLHPEQLTSQVTGPSPPRWWHAAAEQRIRRARGRSGRGI